MYFSQKTIFEHSGQWMNCYIYKHLFFLVWHIVCVFYDVDNPFWPWKSIKWGVEILTKVITIILLRNRITLLISLAFCLWCGARPACYIVNFRQPNEHFLLFPQCFFFKRKRFGRLGPNEFAENNLDLKKSTFLSFAVDLDLISPASESGIKSLNWTNLLQKKRSRNCLKFTYLLIVHLSTCWSSDFWCKFTGKSIS